MNKKIIFFGCGSIGQRHIRNVKSLGYSDLFIYDPNEEHANKVAKEQGATSVSKRELWNQKYDVSFVTNPSAFHLSTSIEAAERGCHLFIEKSLATTMEGIDKLEALVKDKNLVTLAACNMRFHPGPKKVKQLLEEGSIGNVSSAYITCASYLPSWRPWQDYKQSYSGRKDLGGGVVLDAIHEIDLACWYFGIPTGVKADVYNSGQLGIEVEDVANILFTFKEGFSASVYLSYVSSYLDRSCRITGETGIIWWDWHSQEVKVYNAETRAFTHYKQPDNYETNQMYLDEIHYFFDCIDRGVDTENNVSIQKDILESALKAKAFYQ